MQASNLSVAKRCGGFSLIELMIVVAVVAIIASVALPNYRDHVIRATLTDGTSQLASYRVALERYYQDNRNYGTAGGACGATVPTATSNYVFNCVVGAAPADTFVVTLTTSTGLGATGSYVYTLNEQNVRQTTTFKGASSTKTCWLIKGTEC